MNKLLKNTMLLVPLFAATSCGPQAPKEDPYAKYKPTEAEWAANIERIKTGKISANLQLNWGEGEKETINLEATATKVKQHYIATGSLPQIIVNENGSYFNYYQITLSKWGKEESSLEDFNEVKYNLLPMQLVYSNFTWGGETYKMTNVEPIVSAQEGETITFTNVSVTITPSTKQISLIEANVTTVRGEETTSGTMKIAYTYKPDTFDIEVPVVE